MTKMSLEQYHQRAAEGDVDALFELAWGYYLGQVGPKDMPRAVGLLRQLEEKSPQFARFNIAKMKYLEGDLSFQNDIRADCEGGYGPALYLMGLHSQNVSRQRGSRETMRYLQAATQTGHLPSKVLLWRFSKLSLWRYLVAAIPAYATTLRMIAISMRNSNDVRVLM